MEDTRRKNGGLNSGMHTNEIIGVYRLSASAARAMCQEFAVCLRGEPQGQGEERVQKEIGTTWLWTQLRDKYGCKIGGVDLGEIVGANTPDELATMDVRLRSWC
jgi:hypothetical protein